ncbi:glycine-rich domain-containing protein [Planomonospora algeriensis]
MTVTTTRPAATDPRTLITPELHARLVARIKAEHPQQAHLAEPIMDQTLAFLSACATRPNAHLSPSELVDIGWHTFILYTQPYAEFCDRVAGRFIHHRPEDGAEGGTKGGCTAADTVAVMRELGLPVITDLWSHAGKCEGSGTGSCSQCHQGCTDSPTK